MFFIVFIISKNNKKNSLSIFRDSPGGPVSASAHEIFRGFSFVAPCLLDETTNLIINGANNLNMQQARLTTFSNDIPGVKPGVFSDEYSLMQELGRGSFSVCKLCEHKTTRKNYAAKVCLSFFSLVGCLKFIIYFCILDN